MVMVAMETVHGCHGNKKSLLRSLIPFCYKFVVQILSVQIFNFSVEILQIKLPSKKVSIQHTKRLKDIFSCDGNLYLHFVYETIKNY